MMTVSTMVTTPIKERAAACENPARRERTVANELPQELSRLPAQYGFSGANPCLKRGKAATHGGREKAGRPKKAAVLTATGFTDDGHPTILAATRG
jgi:hypothetical protein